MADEQRGLLDGLDPEILKQLRAAAAAWGPSDEVQQKAKMRGILDFGLGLLSHSYQPLGVAAGQAGLLGVQGRDQYLQQDAQQRSQGMQGVTQMMNLQNMMQQSKDEQQYRQVRAGQVAAQGQPVAPTLPQFGMGDRGIGQQPSPQNVPRLSTSKMSDYQKAIADAQYLEQKGVATKYVDAAYAKAEKLRPEVNKEFDAADAAGNPVKVVMYKDGSREILHDIAPKPDYKQVNLGGTEGFYDPNTKKWSGQFDKTQTLESVASNAVTMRGQNMTDARSRDALAAQDNEPMSPAAIDNAAARYNIDGTLPAMGMGRNARTDRKEVLNRAAELASASGLSGDDQRIQQIGNKANTASLAKLGQQATMVGAFEKTFNKNADLVLEYSNKVDRTGAPIANKWINAGKRAVTGDPELSAFDVAVKSASNEYAKIISGSMGNTVMAEGEIKKVEGMLNAAQTPEQVKEVIAFMKRETQNRMAGFKEQDKELRDRMRGKSASSDATSDISSQSYGQGASQGSQSAGVPQSRYKGGVVVQLPDGKYKDFINQKYADQFRAAAGL